MKAAILPTARAAFAANTARAASFWSQVAVMVVNDIAWVAFWALFFNRVGGVRGWDGDSILVLFAVLTTSAGFVLGVVSNARRIPSLVGEGALDEVLSLPISPLPHLLVRRIDPINLGDVLFGIVLFAVAGHPTPMRTLTFVLVCVASAALLTGFFVAIGSIVFFTGSGTGLDLGFHAMLMLGNYPIDIFGGMAKVVLYTAIPAAFVSAVPAKLIIDPQPGHIGMLVAATIVFVTIGSTVFNLGVRRYTSGSAWGRT